MLAAEALSRAKIREKHQQKASEKEEKAHQELVVRREPRRQHLNEQRERRRKRAKINTIQSFLAE